MKVPCGHGAAYHKRETVAVDPARPLQHQEEAAAVTMAHCEDEQDVTYVSTRSNTFGILEKYGNDSCAD